MATIFRISVLSLLSVLWFLMLNVYPLQHLPIFEYAYDWRRILQLSMLGVIALWLLLDVGLRRRWLQCYGAIPQLARIGILLFFGWGLISSLLAPMPKFAFMEVGFYGLAWIIIVTVATLRIWHGAAFDRWILTILMIICGAYGVYLLTTDVQLWFLGAGKGVDPTVEQNMLLAPSFMNVRFFANMISFSLPLIVLPSLLFCDHPRPLRWIYFAISVLWWYALILNHCQTLWLEWVVIPVVVLAWFRSAGFLWLKQHVKAAVCGSILYVLLTIVIPWFLPSGVSAPPLAGTDDGRLALWWYTLKMIVHHPVFGVGPLHFAYYENKITQVAHPHNSVLLLAVEWGIPAALLLLSLIGWGLVKWVKYYRLSPVVDINRIKYIALSAAFLGGAIDSLLSGVMVMPLSQLMMMLTVGWMLGVYYSGKTHMSVVGVKPQIWLAVTIIMAGVLLGHGLYPLILQLPEQVATFIQQSCGGDYDSTCIVSPNFWAQGWIQYYTVQ